MNRLRLREIGISAKRKGISCMHQVVSTMSCPPPEGARRLLAQVRGRSSAAAGAPQSGRESQRVRRSTPLHFLRTTHSVTGPSLDILAYPSGSCCPECRCRYLQARLSSTAVSLLHLLLFHSHVPTL